ncbi:MAG: hypothetical protein QG599_2027 [Pseudomonadota bacterium]|nr:hypothetical protein [Pseudomonadota bacterium]
MTDQYDEIAPHDPVDAPVTEDRRLFLRGLGKWSQAVIGGVLLGGALAHSPQASAWVNRGGGGGWVNRYGGGGWANRSGGGSAAWVNRSGGGGWINGGGGGGWVNRYGGGGSWVNRRY